MSEDKESVNTEPVLTEYQTLEKVADEMLITLKNVLTNLQQQNANNVVLAAQLSQYINKIESDKKKSD